MRFHRIRPGTEYSTVTGSILGRDAASPRLHYGLFTPANGNSTGRSSVVPRTDQSDATQFRRSGGPITPSRTTPLEVGHRPSRRLSEPLLHAPGHAGHGRNAVTTRWSRCRPRPTVSDAQLRPGTAPDRHAMRQASTVRPSPAVALGARPRAYMAASSTRACQPPHAVAQSGAPTAAANDARAGSASRPHTPDRHRPDRRLSSTGRTRSGACQPSCPRFCWLRLRLLRRLLLCVAVPVDPPPDPGEHAQHGTHRRQPPPRQLHQPRQQHPQRRRQRPVPRARPEHQAGDHRQPADVPGPAAEQPVQPQQPDQDQDRQAGQPRDPEPPRERPQQQRRRDDPQPDGAAPGTGQPAPAVCGSRGHAEAVPAPPAHRAAGPRDAPPHPADARPGAAIPRTVVSGTRPSPADTTGEPARPTRLRAGACRPGGS